METANIGSKGLKGEAVTMEEEEVLMPANNGVGSTIFISSRETDVAAAADAAHALLPASHAPNHSESFKMPSVEMDEYNWRKVDLSPHGSFRKKFVFTVPGVMKQEQPREYKLKALVVFLFFLVVIYISLTYVFHKQQQLHLIQVEISERIHFREDTRLLRLFNSAKHETLSGYLGVNLPRGTPYDCLHLGSTENKCLEWKNAAQLRMTHVANPNGANRCFNIVWKSLHKAFEPCDCFAMVGHWYGMGETKQNRWPLEKNSISFHPFVTGDLSYHPFGSAVERYWLSSQGTAVLVEPAVPLFVSVNGNSDGKLCFKTKFEDPYVEIDDGLPVLNYTICTGNNMKNLHLYVASHFRHPRIVTSTKNESVIERVVWITDRINLKTNHSSLISFIRNISESSFLPPGIIIISEGWQISEDEHNDKFRDELNTALNNSDFQVMLAILPYISTSSKQYLPGIEDGLWILDAKGIVPGLTRWKSLHSAAIIDFTNNQSISWFNHQLTQLKNDFKLDGFFFMGGETNHLPHKYVVSSPVGNPDKIASLYAETASKSELAFISTSSDAMSHPIQAFITLSPRTSSWDDIRGLKSVIRSVLTLGIIGYPFVNPGSVGGDQIIEGELPESELFIRWLQLATFLPVMQFSIHPSEYGDEAVNQAEILLKIRKNIVIPLLMSLAKDATAVRMPLIRPLWWVAPNDSVAANIDTQFLIGDNLLIVPVLDRQIERQNVYFPTGFWQDAVAKENIYKGGRWEYQMPMEKTRPLFFNRVNFTD